MNNKTEFLANALEAVLFASDEPLEISQLASCMELEIDTINELLEILTKRHENMGGLELKQIGNGFILIAKSLYNDYIKRIKPFRSNKLSRAAMETLAIVAFKQPITKIEIASLRGVKCDSVMSMLIEKGLVIAVGRKETIGRPIVYGTTDTFIQYFGLSSIDDLPKPENLKL